MAYNMALFEMIPQDEVACRAWMEEIHHRIHLKAHQQSEIYNFDFYQGIPCRLSAKYHWEQCTAEGKSERRSSLACSSYSILTTQENTEEIPLFFENDVHIVVSHNA